jgi:anti-anti-sigma factor
MFSEKEISKTEVQLTVQGPLGGEKAEEFQESLQKLASGGYKTISLDLSGVPSMNSTCIGKILLLRKNLAEQDRTIRIKGCSETLYSTFQLLKFDKLVCIETKVDQAE